MPVQQLIQIFEQNRNPENSLPMQKYMKDKFPFLGIKAPERRKLMGEFFRKSNILKKEFDWRFVEKLWELAEREFQYAAVDYIEKSMKKLKKEDLLLLEKLITTKSWWDTVDALATKPVGKIASLYPEVIGETIEKWASGDNIWLIRTAILFQLKYKDKTDEQLLYRFILQNKDSNEFFIQKAIGWALREYSKTNPESVKKFILANKLAKLSVREGSKYIDLSAN